MLATGRSGGGRRAAARGTAAVLLAAGIVASGGVLQGLAQDTTQQADPADQADREAKLKELFSNAVLVGQFTVAGRDRAPREERYHIRSIEKVSGRTWMVNARIKYGENDVEVPVPVFIDWVDETPILSVTDLAIPLLGQGFSARIVFYKDHYAGIWGHGEAGGHMWGDIEHAPPENSSN